MKCFRCKKEKEIPTNSYCKACYNNYIKTTRNPPNIHKDEIINFVNRIRSNNGLASLEDILLHLINYYEMIQPKCRKYSNLKGSEQISIMWEYLQKYADNYQK